MSEENLELAKEKMRSLLESDQIAAALKILTTFLPVTAFLFLEQLAKIEAINGKVDVPAYFNEYDRLKKQVLSAMEEISRYAISDDEE